MTVWQYKVYVDIRGVSPNFYENFCQTFVYLSPYVVLVICPKFKDSSVMTCHSRLSGKGQAVPKSSSDCGN